MPNVGGRNVSGVAVGVALVGVLFAYSGLKGKGLAATTRSFLAGQNPTTVPVTNPITGAPVTIAASQPAGASMIGEVTTGGYVPDIASALSTSGFNTASVAGFLGNIQLESGFDPENVNPGEGAIGFCQWEGGRRVALQAYAASIGKTETDETAQIGFMIIELSTTFAEVRAMLVGVTDPGQAATIIDEHYEISAGSKRNEKIAAAQQFYQAGY